MFVVKTPSATVVVRLARSAPRNRVPSSRRRNPGTASRSATLGLLGRWCGRCRRGRLGRAGHGGRRRRWSRRQRNAGRTTCCGSGRRRGGGRRGREGLIEHRLRRAAMRRRDREDERQQEEQRASPPARLGQQVTRLPRAEQRIGGAAHAAEARGQAVPLARLQQDGGDQHEAVENEQDEQKGEHAAGKAEETSGQLNLKYAVTYSRASSELASPAGVADRRPALRLQTRATDEKSVHSGRRQKGRGVRGGDASAVENRDRSACIAGDRAQLCADGGVRGGCILRGRRAGSADRPYRLVWGEYPLTSLP